MIAFFYELELLLLKAIAYIPRRQFDSNQQRAITQFFFMRSDCPFGYANKQNQPTDRL